MKKYLAVLVMCSLVVGGTLVSGCATINDPNLSDEERQAKINAAVGFAQAALDEILALTGNSGSVRDYISEHPDEAAHLMSLARLAINGAIFVGAEPQAISIMKATFQQYTGEPFDIYEPLE